MIAVKSMPPIEGVPHTHLAVKVTPGARRTQVGPWVVMAPHQGFDGALKITVTQVAERGRATHVVVKTLAAALGIPPSSVQVVAGATASVKILDIPLDVETLTARLGVL